MLRALFLLACVMVVAGGAAMINGSSMILNERGWSQLIAGSVVLTGGLIVTALAGLLYHLQNLWEKGRSSVAGQSESHTQSVLSAEKIALDPQPVPAQTASLHETLHKDVHASSKVEPRPANPSHHDHGSFNQELAQTSPLQKDHPQSARLHDDPLPVFVSLPDADYDQFKPLSQPAGSLGGVPFSPEPSLATRDAAAARPQLKQPSLFEVVQDQHQGFGVTPSTKSAPLVHHEGLTSSAMVTDDRALKSDPVMATPPQEPKERVLLASYSTGGVGYFMYSDQSIEAEMAIGRYRFQSMDELRTFIETQVGGERVSDASGLI